MMKDDCLLAKTLALPGAPNSKVSVLPLALFVVAFIITLVIILCTDLRFSFCDNLTKSLLGFASILLGFIIGITVTRFDNISNDVNTFEAKICYLKILALKYKPSSLSYLIEALKAYQSIDYVVKNPESQYALYKFQSAIRSSIPKKNRSEIEQLGRIVNSANDLLNDRINPKHLVSDELWYILLLGLTILTIILPLNCIFCRFEAVLATILIWIPITAIYYVYYRRQTYVHLCLDVAINHFNSCV